MPSLPLRRPKRCFEPLGIPVREGIECYHPIRGPLCNPYRLDRSYSEPADQSDWTRDECSGPGCQDSGIPIESIEAAGQEYIARMAVVAQRD